MHQTEMKSWDAWAEPVLRCDDFTFALPWSTVAHCFPRCQQCPVGYNMVNTVQLSQEHLSQTGGFLFLS